MERIERIKKSNMKESRERNRNISKKRKRKPKTKRGKKRII